MSGYAMGLDYGTNSARCVVVRLDDGTEVSHAVFSYPSGENGILLDDAEPELARQEPQDYLIAAETLIRDAIAQGGFDAKDIKGIGVDTTGSTPFPIDESGLPLDDGSLGAKAWLWKDHTAHAEAAEVTELAAKIRPEYLKKCGGAYSSEWFWSKILRCARQHPDVFEKAHSWIECADFIPAALAGNSANPFRGICAAGHKGMYHKSWGGYPDEEFLSQLDPRLARVRKNLPEEVYVCGQSAGKLSTEWAEKTGLPAGIPISIGGIDAHLGAVGSGIKPGTLVKILGTSSCDMAVWPLDSHLKDIPGISGIVPESILPGMYGLEAGQAAVGDLFNWFVDSFGFNHNELSEEAAKLAPGQSGLLALDWNNGNRNVLADPRLTGVILGQTLRTKPHEIYRALIEATAFGALAILERFEEYGASTKEIIVCGGIAEKNPLILQIYADVTSRELKISRSSETCALGATICGAIAGGAFNNFAEAQRALTGTKPETYRPNPKSHAVYRKLFKMYLELQETFGIGEQKRVMKELLVIRDTSTD